MLEYVICSLIIGIKVLLISTDPSTDFEVHRNWKAITTSLPIEKWYFDETSEWTLDYPPLFAYMEFLLGYISKYFDPEITKLDNLYYKAFSCVLFQRITVIVGDLLLLFSIKRVAKSMNLKKENLLYSIILIQGFAGLIIVDNMHFQYNTILIAIFLISLSLVFDEEFIIGAVVYSVLLNMKHIFIYMAPAYFLYYLKYYVFKDRSLHFKNFLKLGFSVISVFCFSFAPFIYYSIRDSNIVHFNQILKRLFPFKRGLLHTYWAPNFWAIFSFVDKVVYSLIGSGEKKFNTSSQGLTQNVSFDVLPDIPIKMANLLVISLSLLLIIKALLQDKYEPDIRKRNNRFINYLITSSLIFFNFGFQVHEKAFIKISLLATLWCINKKNQDENDGINKIYFLLLVLVGIFSQMPLIHTIKDYLIKLLLVVSYILIAKIFIVTDYNNKICKDSKKDKNMFALINFFINTYIFFTLVLDFIIVIHPVLDLNEILSGFSEDLSKIQGFNTLLIKFSHFKEKYQFLPLMLFSVINAFVVQLSVLITLFIA